MAREFQSGLEGTPATGEFNGTPVLISSPVRTGAQALNIRQSAIAPTVAGITWVNKYIRCYLYLAGTPTALRQVVGSFLQADVIVDTSRQLVARNDNSSTAGTTAALNANEWYRIEVFAVAGVGTGTMEVRVDGVTVLNLTGMTITAGNMYFGGESGDGGVDIVVDDIAVNDTAGSINNSWPGPGQVTLLNPVSDTATINWTSTGAGHSTEIDDLVSFDTATIISTISKTQDFEDRWNIGTLPSVMDPSAAVSAIMFGVHGGGDGGTSRTALLRLTSGADVLNSADTEWNLNGYKTVWPIITREQTWGGTPVALTRAYLAALTAAAIDTNTNTRLINWATVWGSVDWEGHAWLPAPPSQALQRVRR